MVYGLFKLCWLVDVLCTCFKETTPVFNVHLSCFVDFILCPTEKYIFKVNNKKIWLICWISSKVKCKHSMTSFRCIYCWPWPQSTYQYSASTFNFKEAFVSSVRKTSHNVLKNQKSRYLYRNKRCKAYFIERFIITPNWNKLWIFQVQNLLYESQVYYRFDPLFDLLYHRYFLDFFLLYQTENLFKFIEIVKKIGRYLIRYTIMVFCNLG